MPEYKFSMVFKYISGNASAGWKNIPGGWTESVFWNSISTAAQNNFINLARTRAALLPNFCAVVGIRFQQVDPSAPAQTRRVNYAGRAGEVYAQDIPQAGLLMSIPGNGVSNVRRHRLAALPDVCVKRGEFWPDEAYDIDFAIYKATLNGWHMRGADLTLPYFEIKTIDAAGAFVTNAAHPWTAGQIVGVRSTITAQNRTYSQQCVVEGPITATTGVFRNWKGGACTLGKGRRFSPIYPTMNTAGITNDACDIVVRKIGRPTRKYVGRQRRRRR